MYCLHRRIISGNTYAKLTSTKELRETIISNKMNRTDYEPSRSLSVRRQSRTSSGFTIVELLVVIVIIGILAAVTIVAYSGINKRAIDVSLQSDLTSASTKLKLYQVDNMAYPTLINSCPTPSAGNICLKSSPGNTYSYSVVNTASPQTYSLTETNTNGSAYVITHNSSPTATVAVVAPVSQVFNSTGNFTVPVGVTSVILEVWGGRGSNCNYDLGGDGGIGGYAKGTLAVVAGDVLNVNVGSDGTDIYLYCGSNRNDGGATFINRPAANMLLQGVGGEGADDCDCSMNPRQGITYAGLTNVSTGSAGPTHAVITYTTGS